MILSRRCLLSAAAVGVAVPPLLSARPALAQDATRAERAIGSSDAKTVVHEFFSLTCSHCATFSRNTMPQVKEQLVDTGKIRFVFHDYPLDQVALTAAMVARYLPVDRYEPFITALLANQDRWAFARGINPTEELWKTAALAGMSRATFDKAISDTGLRDWILQQQEQDQRQWKVDSTPSFVINGQKYTGDMSFDAFRKLIPA